MKSAPPLILFALLAYTFLPMLLQWLSSPDGAWYRPFLLWLALIVVTYIVQRRSIKEKESTVRANRRAEDRS